MRRLLLISICISVPMLLHAENRNLPSFGDRTSGIISLEQERQIGQDFLRQLRAQAPILADAVLQDFIEHLIYGLAVHSELQDRRLDVVIIENRMINAFAAPGGILGINQGLFLYGQTKHETSAILAHELAHLSQRHFARQAEASRQPAMINLAGMLAAIVLTATVGGDAGMVAMTAGRSIAQNQILRFSRAWESEADRIGINTLIESGNDPRAMAYMFERLDQSSRFAGEDRPEFLRTHPVTRKRISDSYNQVQNEPEKDYKLDVDYQFMRHRVIVQTADSKVEARQKMLELADSPDPVIQDAARYGLVLALTDTGGFDRAIRELATLQDKYPDKISLTEAEADIHIRARRPFRAIEILEDALSLSPKNYPLTVAYSKALVSDGRPADAEVVLEPLTQERPNDAGIWYLLAETRGLADNILGVHEARAEYFVLVGNLDQAIKQLGFAIPMVRDNFQRVSRIRSRIDEISRLRDRGKKRG